MDNWPKGVTGVQPFVVIPARAGSRRIGNKNLCLVGDRPLVQWSIEIAKMAYGVLPYVSTDSDEISAIASRCGGLAAKRPPELATDEATATQVVLDLAERFRCPENQPIVLLQPTSPFRLVAHLKAAFAAVNDLGFPSAVGIGRAHGAMVRAEGSGTAFAGDFTLSEYNFNNTDDYAVNGSIFAARHSTLKQHRTFLVRGAFGIFMDSIRSIEIDHMDQLRLAQIVADQMMGTVRL